MEKTVNSFDIETVFCIGNHDWTHARDYQSEEQRKKNMPRFNGIFRKDGNGDCELYVRDYGDFALVSIDDGRGTVSKKALDTLKNFAKSKKNVIILMHIPVYADTLTEDCVKVWGGDGCIGSEETKWRIDAVTEEFVEFLHSEESTVSAIIAGDIHFDHTDRISEKTVQYCLGTSYSFRARIFDIHG